MSDNNELNIGITASDSSEATLRNLQSNIRQVEAQIRGLEAAGKGELGLTKGLRETLGLWKEQAAAIQVTTAAVKAQTAAIVQQGDATAVIHRTLQQGLAFNAGADNTRNILSASSAARTLSTSLSAAAEADSRLRDAEIAKASSIKAATAAVYEQAEATKTLASVGALQRAERAGTPGGLITAVEARATIDTLHGIQREMLSAKESAAAFQAELGEVTTALTLTPAASFNRMVADLADVKASYLSAKDSAAAFEAAGLTATERRLGLTAESVAAARNAEKLAARSRYQPTGTEIVAGVSPGAAGAQAAAQSALRGGNEGQQTAAASKAAADALERQAKAARAVEAAERAAAAAGLSQGEITAAGARAATMALEQQAGAAARTDVMSKETRHLVAAFDELARGQKGALFGTIGAAARDAGTGVTTLATSVAGLAGVMAVSSIFHAAEAMGEWATKARAAASATGMSIKDYTALAAAMGSMGLKADEADASLRHMAESLATAIDQPASKAAEAFHNMGIRQEELAATGGNTSAALRLLAEAFIHAADDGNKTSNMNEILGRGFEKIIPLLAQGGQGLDALKAKMEELGLALDESGAAKLEKTGQAVHDLGEKIKGEGIAAMEKWGPVIEATADLLGRLGSAMSFVVNSVGAFGSAVGTVIAESVKAEAAAVYAGQGTTMPGGGARQTAGGEDYGPAAPKRQVPALQPSTSPLAAMRAQMDQAALSAAQSSNNARQAHMAEAQAEIAVMQKTLAEAKLTDEQKYQLEAELAQKQTTLRNEQLSAASAGAAAGRRAAQQSYEDFAGAEKLKISQADGDMGKITAIYDQWLSAAEGRYKQHASVIEGIEKQKTQAINAARLAQVKDDVTDAEQQARTGTVMAQAQNIASGKVKYPGQIGGGQETGQGTEALAAEAQAIQARLAPALASAVEVMNTSAQGSALQREAAKEVIGIITQETEQKIALYNKASEAAIRAANKMLEPFTKMFEQLGGQFEGLSTSLVDALIAPKIDLIKQGLTTIKINERNTQVHQALQKFALDMVNDATKSVESAASTMLFSTIAKAVGMEGVSSLGGLVAGGISKLTGVGSAATQQLNTAQFGLATTQLQAAATTLQAAATTLSGGAAASAATGAGATAASSTANAVTTTTPIVSAITASTTAQSAAAVSAATSINATAVANTTLIVGAIESQGGIQDALLGALNVKPSLLGFTYAQGGIVPSAAGGMIVGGNGASIAMLHAKEMVLPARLSTGIQQMINNGGQRNANLTYSPTINTSSRSRGGTGMSRSEFSEMMNSHGGAMFGEARNLMRSGWRPG